MRLRGIGTRAAQGAGLGAVAGTPAGGIGAGPGALVGAGIGAGWGVLESLLGESGDEGIDWEREKLGKLRQYSLEDDERRWRRQMEGLRLALAKLEGPRAEIEARYGGANRPAGNVSRIVGAQPGMSDAQYLASMMNMGR